MPDEVKVAYPVWSCNADQTLLCIGRGGLWFAKGYHDNPEINFIANTAQCVLADLFISLYESDKAEIALKEGAQASGFRFLDRVIEFSEKEHVDYYESHEKFINKIDELAKHPISDEELARIEDYLQNRSWRIQ